MGYEEIIQDGCLCWRENDKSPWIRYTPQELTKKIDEFYSSNKHLRARITELEAERDAARAKSKMYMELILAVVRKFPDESRHQTALRYIREAEKNCMNGPAEAIGMAKAAADREE